MRLLRPLQRLRGFRRLRYGWCPACNSSPPRTDCPICLGSRQYGPALTDVDRQAWRQRWERMS